MSRVLSKYNCTTNILSSEQTFNGIVERIYNYGNIIINIKSDQDSDTDGIKIYFGQSSDNLELTQTYTYLASDNNKIISISNYNSYFKLVYINGNVAQTEFSIQTFLSDMVSSSSSGTGSSVDLHDGNGNIVTSTIVNLKRGLDVNIIAGGGGAGSDVNVTNTSLDVHCFGSSDGTVFHHLKTNINGQLQVEARAHDGVGNNINSTVVNTVRGLNTYNVGYDNLGSFGNILNGGSLTTLTATSGLNINKTYLNDSVIIYEDTNTSLTSGIVVQVSQDDITYYTLATLFPVTSQAGKRATSSKLLLKPFNYIRILNNSASTYSNVLCSLFSS